MEGIILLVIYLIGILVQLCIVGVWQMYDDREKRWKGFSDVRWSELPGKTLEHIAAACFWPVIAIFCIAFSPAFAVIVVREYWPDVKEWALSLRP